MANSTDKPELKCHARRHMDAEFRVYDAMLAICKAHTGDGQPLVPCYAKIGTLQNMVDRSKSQVRDQIRKLEESGWIVNLNPKKSDGTKARRRTESGRETSDMWKVLEHDEYTAKHGCPPWRYDEQGHTLKPGRMPPAIENDNVRRIPDSTGFMSSLPDFLAAGIADAIAAKREANAGNPAQANAGNPAQANAGNPAQARAGNPAQARAGNPAQARAGNPAQSLNFQPEGSTRNPSTTTTSLNAIAPESGAKAKTVAVVEEDTAFAPSGAGNQEKTEKCGDETCYQTHNHCDGCGKVLPLGQDYCNEDCKDDAEIRTRESQIERDYERFMKNLPKPLAKFRIRPDEPARLKKLIEKYGLKVFAHIVMLWAMNRESDNDKDYGLNDLMFGWSKFLLEYLPRVKDAENTAKHAEQNKDFADWLKWKQ